MAVLAVREWGDPVLRQKARPVERVTDLHRSLIKDMIDTMRDVPGIGLAGPQVGVSERIFVYEHEGEAGALINPAITRRSEDKITSEEGCLSIPGLYYDVERATEVSVEGVDADGAPVMIEGAELLARIFQHEIDHLDGILFLDHLSPIRRQMLVSKWRREHKDDTGYTKEVQAASAPPD